MPATPGAHFTHNLGHKRYEIANHLGNVLATVSDRRLAAGTGTASGYLADIYSLSDYYPALYKCPVIAHTRPYAAVSHFLDAGFVFVLFARLGEASALPRARGRLPARR